MCKCIVWGTMCFLFIKQPINYVRKTAHKHQTSGFVLVYMTKNLNVFQGFQLSLCGCSRTTMSVKSLKNASVQGKMEAWNDEALPKIGNFARISMRGLVSRKVPLSKWWLQRHFIFRWFLITVCYVDKNFQCVMKCKLLFAEEDQPNSKHSLCIYIASRVFYAC